MLFAYASIFAMIKRKWMSSSILYSLGVGTKMNVLLFAPGIVYILLKSQRLAMTFFLLSLALIVQVTAYREGSYTKI
jgi:alpha-1,3-mannosyltransferase